MTHRDFTASILPQENLLRRASRHTEYVQEPGWLGASVEITMEIHAELPEGASEHIVRTVTENCRTLKFTNYGFEKE